MRNASSAFTAPTIVTRSSPARHTPSVVVDKFIAREGRHRFRVALHAARTDDLLDTATAESEARHAARVVGALLQIGQDFAALFFDFGFRKSGVLQHIGQNVDRSDGRSSASDLAPNEATLMPEPTSTVAPTASISS